MGGEQSIPSTPEEHSSEPSIPQIENIPNPSAYVSKGEQEVVINGQMLFQLARQKIDTYPHSSIGVITARDKSNLPIWGSGARVSANLVVTAAHNVFSRKQGVFFPLKGFQATKKYGSSYRNIRFHPAVHEQFKEQQGYIVQIWRYPTQYSQKSCKNEQFYDYALLKLVDSIPRPIGGYLRPVSYCHSCLLDQNSQKYLLIYGYPFDKSLINYQPLNEDGTHFRIFQYGLKRSKRVRKIDEENMMIFYEMSTLPGQSGAPILFNNFYIGIHARGNYEQKLNGGRLFDKQMLDYLQIWARQLEGDSFQIEKKISCKHEDSKKIKELFNQLLSKINKSLQMKNYEQALTHYSRVLEIDPNNCEAIKGKGKCFHEMKNYDSAVEQYTKAISINPKDASAYAERAFAFYRRKQYEKCQKDCEAALKIDPNNSDAFAYRGCMNWDLKRYQQSLRDCNMAIKLNGKNVRAINWRGNTYKNLKDYDKALADYTTAIQIDPKYAIAYNNRGNTYYDLKDYYKALADYTTAIQIDPKFAMAYRNRGVTYKNSKDFTKALSDFQSAVAFSPNHPLSLIQIALCCDELGEATLLAESLLKCEQSLSSKSPAQIQIDFGVSESNLDFIRSELSRLKVKK